MYVQFSICIVHKPCYPPLCVCVCVCVCACGGGGYTCMSKKSDCLKDMNMWTNVILFFPKLFLKFVLKHYFSYPFQLLLYLGSEHVIWITIEY